MTDDLIKRLEALTSPCFAIEQEIYQEVHPEAWQKRIDDLLAGPLGPRLSPVDYSGYIKVPAYTASIDAAMTLVPEGWLMMIEDGGKSWAANLASHPWYDSQRNTVDGEAATPAIALCIAALKARTGELT